jgi:nicotinate-nucleotide adenylyltransferase
MKDMLKETIIYGGAFNPPTRAHQAIVQGCIDYAEPRGADVWLLPSANRRDKIIETSRERRVALLEALLQDVMKRTVRVEINTAELDRDATTETYETLQILSEAYPDRMFRWVFGSDSLATMPSWRGGEWLLRNLPMLIAEREGFPCTLTGENAQYLGVKTDGVSSTEVRRRLGSGETYDDLVSPHVRTLLQNI